MRLFVFQFSKANTSNFHGSLLLISRHMQDETLIFRLSYRNLSPFSRYSPLKFAYHLQEIWHVFILDGFLQFFLYFSKEFLYISAINASNSEKVLC